MTNDQYLTISYFVVALLSLGFGATAYRVLQRPFSGVLERVGRKPHLSTWRRTLALSMAMAAVLGFLSVSYQSCDGYAEVIKDRSYLVRMNRDQLQAASEWIVYAVLAWCLVVAICLVVVRRNESEGR